MNERQGIGEATGTVACVTPQDMIALAKEWNWLAAADDIQALADCLSGGVVYDGSFTLAWLAFDERVASAGDGSGAAIVSGPWGERRLNIGDRFVPGVFHTDDPLGSSPKSSPGEASGGV